MLLESWRLVVTAPAAAIAIVLVGRGFVTDTASVMNGLAAFTIIAALAAAMIMIWRFAEQNHFMWKLAASWMALYAWVVVTAGGN